MARALDSQDISIDGRRHDAMPVCYTFAAATHAL
jgi:hypothetical protein